MTEGVLEADGDGNHGQAEITHTCLGSVRFLLPVRVTCSLGTASPSWPKQLTAFFPKDKIGFLASGWLLVPLSMSLCLHHTTGHGNGSVPP